MKDFELTAMLLHRMENEQDKYRDWLLSQSKEEILNHTYEYTVRQDILFSLRENELNERHIRALLACPAPLAEIYKNYAAKETEYMQDLFLSTQNVASAKVRTLFCNKIKDKKATKGFLDAFDFLPNGGTEDAVLLPGKIHGAEHQVYVIYFNPQAADGDGCWEVEILDAERILRLYEEVSGNAKLFFSSLPDYYHGEWYGCYREHEDFEDLTDAYLTADFICGRDGDQEAEMNFLVNWAKHLNPDLQEYTVYMTTIGNATVKVQADGFYNAKSLAIDKACDFDCGPNTYLEWTVQNAENEDGAFQIYQN